MERKTLCIRRAAREIVWILHKEGIPLAGIPLVFRRAEQEIRETTVPQMPSFDLMSDEPISDRTDSATEPKG